MIRIVLEGINMCHSLNVNGFYIWLSDRPSNKLLYKMNDANKKAELT